MGRSVSTPGAATLVAYNSFTMTSEVDCWDCDGTGVGGAYDPCGEGEDVACPTCEGTGTVEQDEDFDYILDDYRTQLEDMFPSVTTCTYWIGREDHAVAENSHATFGISEYCGLVAYWAVPKSALGERWLKQVEARFAKTFGKYIKLGTFSNGEGVYEQI